MNDYRFGNFLYALRCEKGMSQAELGELLGVSNKAVSKWETGAAKPRGNTLMRLAEIFSVTADELLSGERRATPEPDMPPELCREYARLRRSACIALAVSLCALLFIPAFVGVVMGLSIPEEVLGPLGSVLLILTFLVSLAVGFVTRLHAARLKRQLISRYGDCWCSPKAPHKPMNKRTASTILCVGAGMYTASTLLQLLGWVLHGRVSGTLPVYGFLTLSMWGLLIWQRKRQQKTGQD